MEPIVYSVMDLSGVHRLHEIDRSESIDLIYVVRDGHLTGQPAHIECPAWTADELQQIRERYLYELNNGGIAIGAFAADVLVGFGVLGHRFTGPGGKSLVLDLLYVSRHFRKQGIGAEILRMLSDEAKRRGAESLYISATETRSAVSFYRQHGAGPAAVPDEELFRREPHDIHLLLKL